MSRLSGTNLGDPGLRHRMRGEKRRIAGQHDRLDALCREVRAGLERNGTAAVLDDYLRFVGALDAHMTIEEDIYFPALHGLRMELTGELTDLVEAHRGFRRQTEEVRALFEAHDQAAAGRALETLAKDFAAHEAVEEELMARVNGSSVEPST